MPVIEPDDIAQMSAPDLKAEVVKVRSVLRDIAEAAHELFDALDEPSEAERMMPVRVIRPRVNVARSRLAHLLTENTKEVVDVHGS